MVRYRSRAIEGQEAEAVVKFRQISALFIITVYLV